MAGHRDRGAVLAAHREHAGAGIDPSLQPVGERGADEVVGRASVLRVAEAVDRLALGAVVPVVLDDPRARGVQARRQRGVAGRGDGDGVAVAGVLEQDAAIEQPAESSGEQRVEARQVLVGKLVDRHQHHQARAVRGHRRRRRRRGRGGRAGGAQPQAGQNGESVYYAHRARGAAIVADEENALSVRTALIYTDGGAEPNPGVGGWGAVIVDATTGERRELSGGEAHTTNNRMELTAAIRALEALEPGCQVDLHTDSTYVRSGITQWLRRWKAEGWRVRGGEPVKNADLWRELDAASARHRVRWHWVKGHSGQELNERAHTLAAAEIARLRAGSRRDAAAAPRSSDAVEDDGHGGEDRSGAPAPDAEVLLKLSCAGGRGAWAARVRRGVEDTMMGGEASPVTSNRLELLAAADVLAALPEHGTIEWRGGSDYLREGASKWLDGWRRRGYRTSGGDPVKNADLWRRLERPLAVRSIRFRPATDADAEDLAALARAVKERLQGAERMQHVSAPLAITLGDPIRRPDRSPRPRPDLGAARGRDVECGPGPALGAPRRWR